MHKSSILVCLILLPIILKSQINEQLANLCDSISIIDETSGSDYPFISSSNYKIQINTDTLVIEINQTLDMGPDEDSIDRGRSKYTYKMNVNDIQKIEYSCEKKSSYGIEYFEANMVFSALRFYPLFRAYYKNGIVVKKDMFKVKVINYKDTVYFRQITELLQKHIDTENNYIDPSCIEEEIKLFDRPSIKMNVVPYGNLEEPITLNGQTDLSQEIYQVLIGYLKDENIKKIYGYLIIDDSDKFVSFENFQNQMYNHYNTLDSLSVGQQVLRDMSYHKITDEIKKKIEEILVNQNWKTGSCNNTKVNSYFYFLIENPDYIEEIDNK